MAKKKPARKAPKKSARKKHPGGRPPMFGERLYRSLPIGMNDEQIERIDAAARIAGKSRAAFLRDAGLAEAGRVIDAAKRKPQ